MLKTAAGHKKEKAINAIIVNHFVKKANAEGAKAYQLCTRLFEIARGRRPAQPTEACIFTNPFHHSLSNSALAPPSFRPTTKLAFLLNLSRRCSRPALWKQLPTTTTKPHSCFLSTAAFATKQSSPARARVPRTPRDQLCFSPARATLAPSASGLRFCSSEVTSSFAIMASDRDVLPAWCVSLSFYLHRIGSSDRYPVHTMK